MGCISQLSWAILDQRSGELSYANAGHNLPICRHLNGHLEKLLKGGMPLGIIDNLTLHESEY